MELAAPALRPAGTLDQGWHLSSRPASGSCQAAHASVRPAPWSPHAGCLVHVRLSCPQGRCTAASDGFPRMSVWVWFGAGDQTRGLPHMLARALPPSHTPAPPSFPRPSSTALSPAPCPCCHSLYLGPSASRPVSGWLLVLQASCKVVPYPKTVPQWTCDGGVAGAALPWPKPWEVKAALRA